MTDITRIACVGGFLGSGKTTAIIQAARTLIARGIRIGIITNDQGHHLVDTALVSSLGFPAAEVDGGCFCCRFDEFAKQARRLVEQSRAQIILAEAVGSCTDLSATLCRRLRQFHSKQFVVAPLAVMVDPARLRSMLQAYSSFDEKVRYLFGKQLAEADQIILTKADLLSAAEIRDLQEEIVQLVGGIPVSVMSAKAGSGVDQWLEQILTGRAGERNLQLDYDIYGQAEASLRWLNASIDLTSTEEFLPTELAEVLIGTIQEACRLTASAVAHVKIMVITAEGCDSIALTESEGTAAWGMANELPSSREASLIINARVCIDPERLQRIVEDSVEQVAPSLGVSATVCHIESFSPLPPKPPAVVAEGESFAFRDLHVQ